MLLLILVSYINLSIATSERSRALYSNPAGLSVHSYIYANSNIDVLVRLHELNLLPETERLRTIASIRELAVDTPDSGFLREDVRSLITDEELSNILLCVQETLLPDLDNQIKNWRYNYDGDDEPDVYFDEFKNALDDYKDHFKGNEISSKQINNPCFLSLATATK